jgi:LysR family pca operon transcriptional activator
VIDPQIRMRHIRCFLETARLGSLSAAADALHVSQPAASKTIKELEDILGVALFDRSGRRLTLTRAGSLFQRHAGPAMVDLRRAQDMAQSAPKDLTRLAVGALPTAATDLLPLAALRLRQEMPECLLRVTTGPNWMLLSQLREGALDMVVGRMPPAGTTEGLSFRQLYSERVVPVVRPDHPLLSREWALTELDDFPLMLPPSGAVISQSVRTFLHSIGLGTARPAFENVSLAFGRKVVQRSDTIWFISHGVVREELEIRTLALLPLANDLLGGPVGVSMRSETFQTAEQALMLDILLETARQHPTRLTS